MDVCAPPAAPRRIAVGEHAHDVVELLAGQVAVGMRPAHQVEQRFLAPLLARHRGHDLLGEDVERLLGDQEAVEPTLADGAQQRRAFDQVVARQREQTALGNGLEVVAGAAHPLQQGRDGTRRCDLAYQVHGPDVDPQLQRRRRHEALELTGLETALRFEPLLFGERAVVGRHVLHAQPLGEMHRQPLAQLPRVDEHQRGAVLGDELGEPLVDLLPHLARHYRLERR